MITAAELKRLTSYAEVSLALTLNASGYKDVRFETAKFVGMTNGNQFCYAVTFKDEHMDKIAKGKVFLTYDPITKRVTADY